MYSHIFASRLMQKKFAWTLYLFLIYGCDEKPATIDANYRAEIKQWQMKRVNDLKAEDGWLNLAGLFELREGENTFGSNAANDIVFPAAKAPSEIGKMTLIDSVVMVKIFPGVQVLCDGKRVREMLMTPEDESDAPIFEIGALRWYAMKRGHRFYIRLRDLESSILQEFQGLKNYPIDPAWRFLAYLEKYDPPKIVPVPNILGQIIDWESPGALVFEFKNKKYRLDALGKLSDEQLFVIFTDETNDNETYPAGRFMYVDTPNDDNKTHIDFNKAYNPPCAFTEFATCPLPPEHNHIPVRITAGELNYAGIEH